MMNVTGDEVVPRECAEALASAAGDKPIIWYPGAKHTSMVLHLFSALGRVTGHFAPDAW
jgi:hypothetical protein